MSASSKLLKGSVWQYLGSWFDRLAGFVSTIILARILVPDDFGVVAAALIVTGFIHVLTVVGTNQYIIRKKDLVDQDLNRGWSIDITMKSIAAVLLFLSADSIAMFMDDERLVMVLKVVALSPILLGFMNVGMVLYERDLNYKPKFKLGLATKVIGFIVKIGLALYLENYWAFIIAELVEAAVRTSGSFIMHPYRPKITFQGWREQWHFSQWVLLKNTFVFFRFRIDTILLTKFFPLSALGLYTVAKDLATLPAGQIIGPILDPLYVSLSSIHDDGKLFAERTQKTMGLLFILVFPIMFGTYVVADNLVLVLLGDQWVMANAIVMILAFLLLPGILGDFMGRVLTALGKVKLLFVFEVILGSVVIASFLLLAHDLSIEEFAELRLLLTAINTLIVLIVLSYLTQVSFAKAIILMVCPLLASLAMALSIDTFDHIIGDYNALIQLTVQVLFGGVLYFILITACVFSLRQAIKEYDFVWQTFYLPISHKLLNKGS